MKGIFDTKADSGYDDDIARRYHFPPQYHSIAQTVVGDWIIYREPQRNKGRQAYIGVARVSHIESDPANPTHAFAIMEDFLPFDRLVPLKLNGIYAEEPLRSIGDPSRVGLYLQGKSIRKVSEADFASIVRAGLSITLNPANSHRLGLDTEAADAETISLIEAPPEEQERRIASILVNRKIRDASFRGKICDAYDNCCAVTGLCMMDANDNPEVQAAHVLPVASGGPDITQNGIALSGTIHWLFDRHLISIAENYEILVSTKVPQILRPLLPSSGIKLRLPSDTHLWPRQVYLAKHRERFHALNRERNPANDSALL